MVANAKERASGGEPCEGLAEALVAYAKLGAELGTAERYAGRGEFVDQEAVEIVRRIVERVRGRVAVEDGEVNGCIGVITGDEAKTDGIGSSGSTMLDREDERVLLATDVEVGIAPSVEVAAAAQGETGLASRGAILTCMMHDENGDIELPLKRPQVTEQEGDFAGIVLVDAMQADERIEHEQAWRISANGVAKARLIASAIEAEDRDGDDVDGEGLEIEVTGSTEPTKAGLDDGRGVLGHVEEDGARVVDIEGSKAGSGGGDGDGEIESEPGLAAFRSAAEDAHGGSRPDGVNEPTSPRVAIVEVGGTNDGKRIVECSGRGHEPAPSSSSADSMVASSRKLWPRSAASRMAVRSILEAARRTPRLAR